MIVSSGYRKNGFDAYGGKVLKKSDMSYWMGDPELTDRRGVCFELGEEVEEVEADFFELLPTINELRILNPSCRVGLSPEAEKIFKKNRVVVRGSFGSSAESFAKKFGLKFLHTDLELARVGDYYEPWGIDIITLCFYRDGSPYVHQDCRCQGSSAGSTGGGEVDFDLPKKFYMTMTAEDIADKCWGTCRREMISNGVLASFIEKAKAKNGYMY